MVPHLTIARTDALTGPLFEWEVKFLATLLELERMAPVKEDLAEEERA